MDYLQELPSAFAIAVVAARLNDWANEVRHAARRAAARLLPVASAEVLAKAAVFLLDREFHWSRWDVDDAAMLATSFQRTDVADQLANLIANSPTGRMAELLSFALRGPAYDRLLPTLGRSATQPSVRAVAMKTLISGTASWKAGFHRQWIDKTFNKSRRVPTLGARPIHRSVSKIALIRDALNDRSAFVRLVGADALIDERSAFPDIERVITSLEKDRSAVLRSRADFLRRKCHEEGILGDRNESAGD